MHAADDASDILLMESKVTEFVTKSAQDKQVVLGLDAVWGGAAERLLTCLSPRATFVNFGRLIGGSFATALSIPHGSLFGKQINFRSFRGSEQAGKRSKEQLGALCHHLLQMHRVGLIRTPKVELVAWDTREADKAILHRALQDAVVLADRREVGSKKMVFVFQR